MTDKEYNIAMDDFSSIKVSTQTYIVHTNLDEVDLDLVVNNIAIDVPYEDLSDEYEAPEEDYASIFPRIIAVSYKGIKRGKLKKRKSPLKAAGGKNFLNCVSMSVQLDPMKNINVKLFHNGVMQLTGCKAYEHAQQAIDVIWKALSQRKRTFEYIFEFKKDTGFSETNMEAYVVSAMRNVDFRLGFEIDREALGNHINENTPYRIDSILRGFMGVQLSIPIESVADMTIHKITYYDEGRKTDEIVRYDTLWKVKPAVKAKALKPKSITIAVFQTGQVLMSGIDEMYQIPAFKWFINEISSVQNLVKVKKEQPKNFVDFLPKKRRSKFRFKTIFE